MEVVNSFRLSACQPKKLVKIWYSSLKSRKAVSIISSAKQLLRACSNIRAVARLGGGAKGVQVKGFMKLCLF